MPARIRFFGIAAYELITDWGQHILIDPYLDANPGSPVKAAQLEQVDLILVSHAAFDHLGDTLPVAQCTGAPVVCGGEVKAYLMAHGLPAEQIRATTWGIAVEVAGIKIQPVECHHWSQIVMPDGTYAAGVPMGFVIYAAPEVRFYHYGDTAIFSDLRLIADLYAPNVGCIGISQPWEVTHQVTGPGRMLTGEMSPREGALAARWLGLETVLPCHYINPDNDDVREFEACLAQAAAKGERIPHSVVMKPGDVLEVGNGG